MWLLTKKSVGVLWLEVSNENGDHHMLPIFTSPDTAMTFLMDLYHKGELITLLRVYSIGQLNGLLSMIKERQSCTVIVDAPNPDNIGRNDELVYWAGEEFNNIMTTVIGLAKAHGTQKAIGVLDRYLNFKTGTNTQPANL